MGGISDNEEQVRSVRALYPVIQLFEISGIEDVFDDDHDDDHIPYGEKMVIRVTPEKTLSCNVLSERLTIDLYADTPDGVVWLHDQSAAADARQRRAVDL